MSSKDLEKNNENQEQALDNQEKNEVITANDTDKNENKEIKEPVEVSTEVPEIEQTLDVESQSELVTEEPMETIEAISEENSQQEQQVVEEEQTIGEGQIIGEEKTVEIPETQVEDSSEEEAKPQDEQIEDSEIKKEQSEQPKEEQREEQLEENQEQIDIEKEQEQETNIEEQHEKPIEQDKKPNKFLLFLKKYKLPVIIAAAVLLIAAAITTTIAIINAPKIFVKDAEDFLKETTKKEIYILRDDITVDGNLELKDDLNIDLNNKTLTVKGVLKIILDDNVNSTINIGTLKKKEYISGGKIIADSIIISAKNINLNVYSPMTASGSINVKNFKLNEKLTIPQNKMLEAISTRLEINKDIIGALKLSTSYLLLQENASVDSIVCDEFSDAVVYGIINQSLTGGNEIKVLKNASCPVIDGAKTLYYQQETANVDSATNIGNLLIVNQLKKPSQLNIEQIGNTFKCIASKVNNADLYIFTIKDENGVIKTITTESNEADITQYINQPKNYRISVKAASATPKINLESEELEIEYNYLIKLNNPSLSITVTNENRIVLSFPSIDFATVYKININGNIIEKQAEDTDTTSVDLTQEMAQPNSYYIKVTASYPGNSSFTDSDTVMISYIKTEQLATPDLILDRDENSIILSWEKIDKAENYILSVGDKLIMTKNNTLTFPIADIEDGTVFTLYAQGKGYYTSSENATITYVFPQLDKPQTPVYTINNETAVLDISTEVVTNAAEYKLYKNGELIATSQTPNFSIEDYADGDIFQIEASATYYLSAISDEVTIKLTEK